MYAAGKSPAASSSASPPERARNPDRAHDRPADPAAVAQGLPQRDAGRRDDPLGRQGQRLRHPGAERRLDGPDALRDALPGPGRRRAHRPAWATSSSSTRRCRRRRSPSSTSSSPAPPTPSRWSRPAPPRWTRRRCSRPSRSPRRRSAPSAPRRSSSQKKAGKPKWDVAPIVVDEKLAAKVEKSFGKDLAEATLEQAKLLRRDKVAAVRAAAAESILGADPDPEAAADFGRAFDALKKRIIRRRIAVEKHRPDGRKADEIRPISTRGRASCRACTARRSSPAARPRC